jgi:hypothetical protein
VPLPTLTAEQRAINLQKAAAARRARADLKAEIRAGTVSLPQLLREADSDDTIGRLKVSEALRCLPRHGKVRVDSVLAQVGISDTRRLRGLGAQQRATLLARYQ